MIGLCDCNNFFVSCERVFNPALNGKPVVVLSNNDGCFISRSEEAKKLGIKMGQPLYQAKELIEKHNVAVFSSNYILYGDLSQRVMDTLKIFSPSVEIYSIDEAFINFHRFDIYELKEYGKQIAKTIIKNTGIPVSLGIAPTKTLAKVASKLCKKYPKLEGCCLMHKPEDITKVLMSFPIEEIWGIGYRYSKMLKNNNIHTAEQFRKLPPEWIRTKMSVVGLRTWKELHGEPCIAFGYSVPDKQSICVSRSFAKELTAIEPLTEALATFVSMAAEKLRKQNSRTSQLQIFIYTNRHRKDKAQHYESKLIIFPAATNSTIEMVTFATQALKEIYKKNYAYKKAGVILNDISPDTGIQNILFDNIDRSKHSTLMQTMDFLNALHGKNTVSISAQGAGKIPAYQGKISPRFTTHWNEIMVVKV
ncbi:MAG: Y-family DNA polymerase [Bacteroidales bacterium]|jgi:DNA polymerase V|nr:Y-family DNA polymerase [Bacteroidales bacterium]